MTKVLKSQNLEKEIRNLIAEILETEPEKIPAEAHFVKDLGMDSMMALEILAGLEKRYRIVIPEETLPKFTNLDVTIGIVQALLDKQK